MTDDAMIVTVKTGLPALLDTLEDAAAELDSYDAKTFAIAVRQAAAELKRKSAGEWFYDLDDPEDGSDSWADLLENSLFDNDGPMEVGGACEVERFWIARVVLTRDEHGSPDETEIRRFATKAEALEALSGGQGDMFGGAA